MAVTIITPPAVEPVSLTEMKAHLNIIDSNDDDLISGAIVAARQVVEAHLGQSLVATEFDLFLDRFPAVATLASRRNSFGFTDPAANFQLPGSPVLSVESVNYLDPVSAAEVVLDPTLYTVDVASNPARIAPGPAGWPVTASTINAVRVRYVAGYGADAAGVPDALKHAVKLTAASFYENREGVVVGMSVAMLPYGVASILDSYRNWSL